jgi:plastocyanin
MPAAAGRAVPRERASPGQPTSPRPWRARWRWVLAGVAVAAGSIGLAACGNDDSTGVGRAASSPRFDPVVEVRITDATVEPAEVTVRVGDTVRVLDAASATHRLTGTKLDTGLLRPGDATLLYASKPGRFELRLDDTSPVALVVKISDGPASPSPASD